MTTDFSEQEREGSAPAGENPPPPSPPHAFLGALLGAILYLAFATGMTLFNLFPPKLEPVWWVVFGPISTMAYLYILVYTIRLICRLPLRPFAQVLLLVASLLLFAWLNPVVRGAVIKLAGGMSFDEVIRNVREIDLSPQLMVLVPFLLILTGVFFGQLLARIIREKSMLVPVGITAGLIDFWGVYWGPVGSWSEQMPSAVSGMATAATAAAQMPDAVRAQLPVQLQVFGSLNPPSNIGIGDFVFLAFFLTCAYRLGFSARRTMWGIFVGLLIASLLITLDGQELFGVTVSLSYLPGLVFICGGVLLLNHRTWQLSRQEWAMTGIIIAVLATCIGFSVVRAEMNKPDTHAEQFTLTAKSRQALVTDAYQRGLRSRRRKGDPLLLAVNGIYQVTDGVPSLVEVKILAMIRPARPGLRRTYDVYVDGIARKPGDPVWMCQAEVNAPPNIVLGYLGKKFKASPETLIARARGILPADLARLDDVEAMTLPGKDRVVLLVLGQDRKALIEQTPDGKEIVLERFDAPAAEK